MLSKDAITLLRWFSKNDDWWFQSDLERQNSFFDYRLLNALVKNQLIDHGVTEESHACPEYDENWNVVFPEQYRINDRGRAYLESLSTNRWKEFRAWGTLTIAAAALIVSIIALFR